MLDFIFDKVEKIPEFNVAETVSEWAARKRTIGKGLTANPGPFDWKVTPYLREIADNQSDNSPVTETYVIKATQVGFTVGVLENHLGYCIEYGLGPLLYISGDQAMAEEQFEKRVDEMIQSADLKDKIKPNIHKKKGKSTGDRADSKSYGGTFMRAVGPNSESKLRSFPMRFLHEDEIDVYPQKIVKNGSSTGDTLKKAERRTDSYQNLKKIIGGSSPKEDSDSRIKKKVFEGDSRFYNVNCPSCNFKHPLIWSNFKWEKTNEGKIDVKYKKISGFDVISKDPTYFECPNCNFKIKEKHKYDLLLEKGYGGTAEWVPTKNPERPFVRSYHIPGWLGFRTWLDIAIEWENVKDDPFLLPDFVNDVMGETWKESDQKPDQHLLLQIAQEYENWPRGHICNDIVFLAITCDVQKDRLEAGLLGFGRNKQIYAIDYWVFKGETNVLEDVCWKELYEKITTKYTREDGQELFVQSAFIDSQYLSEVVDAFCDQFDYRSENISGVFHIQSRETQDKMVTEFQSNIKTPVVGLHDQKLKHVLYSMLRKKPNGPGQFPGHYFHFSNEYAEEFFDQLTSEEIVTVVVKGAVKGTKILNTKQKRNEVLDIMKMGLGVYQYMMDRYFKILNENRKLQKLAPLQESSSLFMDYMEGLLYE
jgi:phage terminase large subunit GpA-like protein